MKRLIVICEGETEREFCEKILAPHFQANGIWLQSPKIKHSGGGMVNWAILKRQINRHLFEDDVMVSTFIDFYGIQAKHAFPNWEECHQIPDKNQRMQCLETGMKNDLPPHLQARFIPYIQLHEFEGLLFNHIEVFEQELEQDEFLDKANLEKVINDFPNPELINDGKETAPSKRLSKLIAGYNKIVYGNILAEAIGLRRIRAKSPRFNDWITTLENI